MENLKKGSNNKMWAVAQKHLMTATGYMIPFVVAGGVIFAVAVMLNGHSQPTSGVLGKLASIGSAGLALFIPALGGYLAYSIADRPGLAPGFITAYLAVQINSGFIGGIIGGLLAGVIVNWLKKIKLAPSYKVLGSIFLYPLVGTLLASGIIVFLIGEPISEFMKFLTNFLTSMKGAAKIPLGILMGSMIGVDMGGPINKVACTFAQTQVDTLPFLMGIMGPSVCTMPIGLGISTLIFKKKYSPDERNAGKAALLMGFCGISEGAIPFATADPLRVIVGNTVGSAIAGGIAAFTGTASHAPWGGLITLPVVDNIFGYLLAVVVGSLVTAVIVGLWKKEYVEKLETIEDDTETKDINLNIEEF